MWRPLILAGFLAALGCSSEVPAPGPGFPADVRSIRLFDDAGTDRTQHVFLFPDSILQLEVRLYADDGQFLLEVVGGLEMTMSFTPPTIASSVPMPGEQLIRAVTTTAPGGTLGSLMVSLRFLEDGSIKTFGPFECFVH